jgi:hypothetical protein
MKSQIKSIKSELNHQQQPWLEEAVHSVFAASEAFETYVNTNIVVSALHNVASLFCTE